MPNTAYIGLYMMFRYVLIIWGIMILALGIGFYPRYIFYISSIQAPFYWDNVALVPLTFILGPILIGIGIFLLYRDSKNV